MAINRRKFCSIIPFIPLLLKHKTDNIPFIFSNKRMMRVIPVKAKTLRPGGIQLNKTAQYILHKCDGKKSVFDIADAYRKTFNITLSNSINDCITTLKYFKAVGIVKFK